MWWRLAIRGGILRIHGSFVADGEQDGSSTDEEDGASTVYVFK